MTRTQTVLTTLLHRQRPGPQAWKGVTAVVFGNGVQYWEWFYGARSWLIPGALAGILKLFDTLGLGEPFWYVGGVKLALCAISLTIPAAMYVFARRHFGESTARLALVAGALWYELAGFAHKPLSEFLATAAFMGLLAVAVRPSVDDRVCCASILAVLTTALRMQYAPLAVMLLAVVFLRSRRRVPMALVAATAVLLVGIFDAVTWNGGLFHSYALYLRFHFVGAAIGHADNSPLWLYVLWLALASGGVCAITLVESLRNLRRYGFLLALITLTLLLHSLQAHKEYRFIFVVIPLWLMIGADVVTKFATERATGRWVTQTVAAVFAGLSLFGILNLLPYQRLVYLAWSFETGYTEFVRRQDPAFAAYRYLARAPDVKSVWHIDRSYFQTPGYYYLHQSVPFYDAHTGSSLIPNKATIHASASHILSTTSDTHFPGYSLERAFGPLRILRRNENDAPVRGWHSHAPIIVGEHDETAVNRADRGAPTPPIDMALSFLSKPATGYWNLRHPLHRP